MRLLEYGNYSVFDEVIKDQGGTDSLTVEIGRSSYYEGDSIYIIVDGKTVIMDRVTAKRFVDCVLELGIYHGFVE